MKDFIKWLGVNEKVAKVVVWLLIIMVCLIITNTMLESIGFPSYAITYENITKIDVNKFIDVIIACLVTFLNFYAMILLVFKVKEAKKIFKYAVLYLILNSIVSGALPGAVVQIFIAAYIIIFSYLYSGKNWKYILYAIISIVSTIIIQGVWYISKAKFVDYSSLNHITRSILSLDYFIIIGLIILVKEIYLKKRGEKECLEYQHASSGLENSKTKTNSQRKLPRKSQAQSNKGKKRIK